MKIERFEDIIAWQKTKELTINVYSIFKNCRDYGYKDQIQRASISIMNNIAEGFERKTNNEFKHFLFIAKGSCAEVRLMLSVGVEIEILSQKEYKNLYNLSTEISKILSGLIKTL